MINKRIVEITVGLLIIFGAISLFMLALDVSGLGDFNTQNAIAVTAEFSNIGDLKIRSPVKIAGVRVGEVAAIDLDKKNFQARVTMRISNHDNNIPIDSSATILSESLLGSKYISITPGFEEQYLKDGDKITETNSAVILENLIGQAIFKPKDEEKNKE